MTLQSILRCLGLQRRPLSQPAWQKRTSFNTPHKHGDQAQLENYTDKPIIITNEKALSPTTDAQLSLTQTPPNEIDPQANNFLHVLLHAETSSEIPKSIDAITTLNLREAFARLVLSGLEAAIRSGITVSQPMHDAVEQAVAATVDFAKDHPVYATLIALGVLVILAPWILEILGFAELGPVEGSFAALWQARYAGYVPKGSLFSYLQRLGMVWHS